MISIGPRPARGALLLALGLFLVFAILGSPMGCGKGPRSPAGGYAGLAGSWRPVTMVFASKADTSRQVEMVTMGYKDPLVLYPDGTFDEGPFGRGSASLVGDEIKLTFESGQIHFYAYTLRGDTLTIRDDKDIQFDFNGPGTEEPASMWAVMIRQ